MGNARLALAVVTVVLGWFALGASLFHPAWLLLPIAAFVVMVVRHGRIVRARDRAARLALYYEHSLARVDGQWAGTGSAGERFRDPAHPYAEDLDLFGRGSLFERLCTARTRSGEETLARWLREGAAPGEVRERQAAVADLRPRLELRESLSEFGQAVREGVHPEALASWASARVVFPRGARPAAAILSVANAATALLLATGVTGPAPLLLSCLLGMAFALWLRPRVREVLGGVDRPLADLRVLAGVLGLVESLRFEAPLLAAVTARLAASGGQPSRRIAGLARRVEISEARLNQVFTPFALLLLWGTQSALAIEAWRRRSGAAVPGWIEAVGTFEALSSLAAYAYENPADPFPVIVEGGPPHFTATGLGHPLVPRCVPNDVRLDGTLQVLIVSGSNMSGKSTLLRSVGVNTVLALAGAPVRARALEVSPLAIGATLRVQDSLQAGSSRFYAEITRLRAMMERAGAGAPLLFLLDEILHGTNSHDRLIGARAVIRGLVDRGAIGLVTTHDLALSDMVPALGGRGRNVHFEDHLEDGRMVFDYRLHEGVVTRSNAIELMRAVGLEVDDA